MTEHGLQHGLQHGTAFPTAWHSFAYSMAQYVLHSVAQPWRAGVSLAGEATNTAMPTVPAHYTTAASSAAGGGVAEVIGKAPLYSPDHASTRTHTTKPYVKALSPTIR